MTDRTIREIEANDLAETPYDASDPKAVNEARKKAGRRKTKERETIATLLKYENGRELVFDLIKCVFSGNPIVPGDSLSTYYNLGQEHKARDLFKEAIRIAPQDFVTMMEENADKF